MRFTRAQRIVFRFTFAYFFLYLSPTQLFDVLPGMDRVVAWSTAFWNAILPWVAAHVFGIAREVKMVQTGSGDSTADYVQTACTAAAAAVIAALWSALSRPPYRDRDLWTILYTYVRYALGTIMLGYGFAKAFPSQFQPPRPDQLLTPLGNASPMGLLWRFMGYSTPYTILSGLAEIAGGALLFFRRTTTLGALLLLFVVGNVVLLNFCYDVPVKLFSSNLLLMTLFLLWPEARRLATAVLGSRPVAPPDRRPHDLLVRFRGAHIALKAAFLVATIGMIAYQSYDTYEQYGAAAPKSPLYGAYDVETFAKNGEIVAPLLTEKGRWRRVAVNNFMWAAFLMDDTSRRYRMKYDAEAGKVTLLQGDDKEYALTLTRPDPDHVQVEGALEGDKISVTLKKIDLTAMPLVSRGFHWTNEFPYNR